MKCRLISSVNSNKIIANSNLSYHDFAANVSLTSSDYVIYQYVKYTQNTYFVKKNVYGILLTLFYSIFTYF